MCFNESKSRENYFLDFIIDLRTREEAHLKINDIIITPEEEDLVIEFLKKEFENERLSYLPNDFQFIPESALWASKTLYYCTHLILSRESNWEDVSHLLKLHNEAKNESSIISADLCLRFLPFLFNEVKSCDKEDPLLFWMKDLLSEWSYSGIAISDEFNIESFEKPIEHPCLEKLYIDRIIEFKQLNLATNENWKRKVANALGIHSGVFWKKFELLTNG